MGRTYAGVLGLLAMMVVICRGVMNSSGVEGTCTLAVLSMFVFAGVGSVLGHIAQLTVDESVRLKIEQGLADTAARATNSRAKA
jgi:hypothetical protein